MNADNQNSSTEEWPELAEFKQRFRAFVVEKYPPDLARGNALNYSKLK